MRRLVNLIGAITIAAGVLLAVAAIAMTSAGADPVTVEILPSGSVHSGAEGDVFEVAVFNPPVVGLCDVAVETENNPSIHLETDLIISTRGQAILVPSIEDAPGQTTVTAGVLFGRTATVLLRLGPDGIASGGITLQLECEDPPPVTTTTTTAPPPTTLPPTPPAPPIPGTPVFTG